MVDELDSLYIEKTDYDPERRILDPRRDHPSYWFIRRLPHDENLVDHLELIRTTDS